MALVVVDASAVAALIFGEPEAEVVSARLEGFDLAAPALLPFEVANVAVRNRPVEPPVVGVGK